MNLESFFLGETVPNQDPLTISTGLGQGMAQVQKPYSGEAWQQATQNRQRQEQIDLQRQKQQQEDNAPKNDLLKTLSKISGYRPQEFANIKLRHDKLVAQTLALNPSAPDYPEKLAEIQSGLMVLNEGVQGSKDLKKSYEGANDLIQKGTHYFDPTIVKGLTDDYNQDYGIIDDDMKWLDIMGSKAGKATALSSDIPLIKDKNAYLKNLVNSTSRTVETGKSHKDPYSGEWVRETKIITDPDALQTKIELEKANPQIVSLFGSADEFEKQAKASGYYDKKVSAKYEPTNKNTSLGGNTVEAGNLVFSPPIKSSLALSDAANSAWSSYDAKMKAARNEIENKKGSTREINLALDAFDKRYLSKDSFLNKYKSVADLKPIPYSIKGVAENPKHQFIIIDKNGKELPVYGQSNLTTPTHFIVETENGTAFAPIEKNTQYLSDNGLTVDDFKKSISQVSGGKVVTTNKEGNVIKTEKVKTFDYSKGAMQTKAKELGISVQELKNKILSKKPTATFE